MQDADAGRNESQHKYLKASYKRSNHKREENGLQILMAEQVSRALLSERSKDHVGASTHVAADVEDDGGRSAWDSLGAEGAVQDNTAMTNIGRGTDTAAVPMRVVSGFAVPLSSLERKVPGVRAALGLGHDATVPVAAGAYLPNGAVWSGGRRQIVRASADYCGRPWYDWVSCRDAEGCCCYGRARVLLCGFDGCVRRAVVLEAAVVAEPVDDCPFSAYGCTPLQWVARSGDITPTLAVVALADVTRVLCVEYDWEGWLCRKGLTAMPLSVPKCAEEVRDRRFFINVFAG